MKKLIVFLCLILFSAELSAQFMRIVPMSKKKIAAVVDHTVTSYSESNADNYEILGDVNPSGEGQWGETFQSDGSTIDSCKFYLMKSGSPQGNARVRLYAMTGTLGSTGVPTDAALASSNNLDVSTLTGSYQLIKFTFATPYKTSNTTDYSLSLEENVMNSSSTNYVRVGDDESSATYAGNEFYGSSGSWYAFTAGSDFCFYIYGH